MNREPHQGDFPIRGVVGVVADNRSLSLTDGLRKVLGGVEVRADLLLAAGLSLEVVLKTLRDLRELEMATIFTVRHRDQGGAFAASEPERLEIYERALNLGATVVDAEWGTEAARSLSRRKAPILLSHHDFKRAPGKSELDRLTRDMADSRPLGLKLVPTASSLEDAARLLEWVREGSSGTPARVGFAMGPQGVCSRILAIAYGSPLTYAGIGTRVAPGQIPVGEMIHLYRVDRLDASTRVFGVVGDRALDSLSPFLHNPALARRNINAVYLPFQVRSFSEITAVLDGLRIDALSVTIPFKEDALHFAASSDARSTACGASNTLVITRREDGTREVTGHNTDFDGVLIPLRRFFPDLSGLDVAVIGNGGAARGAVQALKEAHARPTIYYRNAERGKPVADELGVPGQLLERIDSHPQHRVYINATPLGSAPDDPSPIPSELLGKRDDGAILAFEMVYHTARTRFVADAEAAGAHIVHGREMLVAQGTVQFELFTGQTASLEELDENYRRGEGSRAKGR